jgi:hypothetical protein
VKKPAAISAGAAAAVAVGVFVALAQSHAISVPYLTPARIEFEGLNDLYPVNGSMDYSVSVRGHGSNCLDFQASVIREPDERVAYFGEVQDCRKIEIAEDPYNYTKSFSYTGATVLGRPGDYRIQVDVLDQITKQSFGETRPFIVVEDSS